MMKRMIFAGALALGALACSPYPAAAQVGNAPWCAVQSTGWGSVYWDCHYATLEQCVPNVLAGNRGTCNHNPAWEGWRGTTANKDVKHKKRHTLRY
jgi:uncharacterized protein DUF3551